MKKFLLLLLVPISLLVSCKQSKDNKKYIKDDEMKLLIDDQELNVVWKDNDSVKKLKELLPLTINMHQYGGFEQTGYIGQSITSNDQDIDVVPGDIVLYSSDQISVFYNSSSWSYTRLGHINLTKSELNTLLNKSSVVFKLIENK